MAKHLSALNNDRNFTRVELLCLIMVREFGGMAGFISAWIEHCHRSMESGGYASLRCFRAVLRLIEFCDVNRPAVSDLSDEQLANQLTAVTLRTIDDHPELAVEALQQAGWQVSRSNRSPDD